MAGYRKLGRTSSQRKAMLRSLVTNLLYHGKITTTVTRAKEVRKIAEKLITLAVREKDNYETVTVTQKVPKKTADGKRVKEKNSEGKMVTVYEEITKTIKKDNPSRLHARRQMLQVFYDITETPADGVKKRSLSKKVDLAAKMFDEIGPKYDNRKGGYTRIVKIGPRKGDAAEMAIIELV
ncbi:MAG: 50S ribosomal protein L17 [Firmicutes bacterium]|jgi:large subunit ribosomal protein L17|nr:50S ribosomal protein L17 [Bacillota bacterium]